MIRKIIVASLLLLSLFAYQPAFAAEPESIRIDYDGSNNPIYIGIAPPGVPTSASMWKIFKITYSGSNPTLIQLADGDELSDNIWDNRTSLTYR